ncbi:MAG: hypothetical protein V3S37_03000 [Dehalococcoidia bacterium]
MIRERLVFQAKYGKASDLVTLIKEGDVILQQVGMSPSQVLTDLTGEMFTVVWERQAVNLSEWEQTRQRAFAHPEFGPWFTRMQELVESGRREMYTIE